MKVTRRNERQALTLTVQALNHFGISRFASIERNGRNHIRVNFFTLSGQAAYVLISNSSDIHARRNIFMNVKRAVEGGARQKFQYRG